MSLNQFSKTELREMPLIEVAYYYLKDQKETISFKELMDALTQTLDLSKQEVKKKISQFYTELNIDGRFLCLGENRWGLRSWYPTDKVEEEIITVVRSKKKKKKKDEDDFDDYDELVEEEYDDEDESNYEDDEDEEEKEEYEDYEDVDNELIDEDDDIEVNVPFDDEDDEDEEEDEEE